MSRQPDAPPADRVEDLLADAEATAEEYREAGWEVLALEPGAVSPADNDERRGFSVVLPGSEYERLEALFDREAVAFESAEVYRRSAGNTTLALAVELDPENEIVVLVPLWYDPARFRSVLVAAADEGEVRIHLRPLSIDRWVTFVHDDPSLFVDEERLERLRENEANAPDLDAAAGGSDDGGENEGA